MAEDQRTHLQISRGSNIDQEMRLEIRNRILHDPTFETALGCEREMVGDEPLEHRRNPG